MHSVLRPNYRRARALALEIEAARVHLDEARGDPSYTLDDIEDLKAELHHLEREFSLTGVTEAVNLTEQARAILSDLAAHTRNTDRRASGEVARMARDAYRDHLADMAVLQQPTLRKLEGLCQ